MPIRLFYQPPWSPLSPRAPGASSTSPPTASVGAASTSQTSASVAPAPVAPPSAPPSAPASAAAVSAPVSTIQVVVPPPAQLVPIMGAPSIPRVSWDRSRPDPVDVATHGQAAFLPWNLQGEVIGSPATPFVLAGIPPLLPRTQGGQPLSRRERS